MLPQSIDVGSTLPCRGYRWIGIPRVTLRRVLAGLAIVVAGLLGVVTPTRGEEALALPLIIIGGLLLLIHPVLGMLLIAATIPLENLIVFEGGITATRILGIFVFGLWISRKLIRRESWLVFRSSPLFITALIFLGLAMASALWAKYPEEALSGSSQLFRLFLLALLVSDLADSWHRIAWLVKVMVLAGLGAAILTLLQFVSGNLSPSGRAGTDIAGGINATARVLVVLVPFAFYLIRAEDRRPWRIFGVLYVAVAVFAVVVTFSRTSLLILALVISAEVLQTLKGPDGRGWVFFAMGSILVATIAVNPRSDLGEQVGNRIQTIVPYLRSSIDEDNAGILSARGYHAKIGLAIFLDHPFVGAGFENYGYLFLNDYQFRISGADTIFGSPRSPHGSYVGFLANLGLLGFAIWLGVIGIALYNLTRAWRSLARSKPSSKFRLVESATYGLLLLIAYGFSSDVHQEKLLWLILGMSVAIRVLVDQTGREHGLTATRVATARI